jgi:hypothetical protein
MLHGNLDPVEAFLEEFPKSELYRPLPFSSKGWQLAERNLGFACNPMTEVQELPASTYRVRVPARQLSSQMLNQDLNVDQCPIVNPRRDGQIDWKMSRLWLPKMVRLKTRCRVAESQ